jgi:hypothetical protein
MTRLKITRRRRDIFIARMRENRTTLSLEHFRQILPLNSQMKCSMLNVQRAMKNESHSLPCVPSHANITWQNGITAGGEKLSYCILLC